MLELLYRTYWAVMFKRAVGVLGDHALAEDAVHEAFIRINKHIKRFEQINPDERRYLCLTIVKNIALNMVRDNREKEEIPDNLLLNSGDINLAMDINDAINSLDEGHRSVVLLRLRYGFDTFETAKLLGLKPGTVLSRLSRARKILIKILKD